MAAGLSRRAAPHNKLLLRDATGIAMVAQVADAVLASRARPVLAVTGHQAAAVRAALAGRSLQFAEAARYATGMAASLRAGIGALPAEVPGVLVCLGDMPLVTATVLDLLIDAFEAEEAAGIVIPAYQGRRGNPVLWPRRFFGALMALDGDTGGRGLRLLHKEQARIVDVAEAGVVTDFDAGGDGWHA